MTRERAVLVLEDGTRYDGWAYGARGRSLGEVVFATGMTGYQETLTDPSYAGQIVVQTAPHIGNTGVNDEDPESRRIWVAGYVVRDPSRVVSNHRANASLDEHLERDGIVGIAGIDTRALTRRIRDAGAMKGGVFSGADAALDADEQLEAVRDQAGMAGASFSALVSTPETYVIPAEGEQIGRLAVLDLGVKASTTRYLAQRGFEVHVVPQDITAVVPKRVLRLPVKKEGTNIPMTCRKMTQCASVCGRPQATMASGEALIRKDIVPKATMPVARKCSFGPTFLQPNSMIPRKDASRKKAVSTS